VLVESDPARFFVPLYVGPSGWVGVRLESRDWDAVAACIREAHAMSRPSPSAADGSYVPPKIHRGLPR
jgi:hypothetical protein